MLLVTLATLVALAATLVALYRDERLSAHQVAAPRAPLPGADAVRVEFPVRPLGYAPAAVDTAYEALRLDYADLLAEAPPEVVERARRRAARRTGVEQAAVGPDDEVSREGPPEQSQRPS